MRTWLLELPDLVCLALVYFAVLLPRWRCSGKGLLFKTVFYLYLCLVLHFTLMPFLFFAPGRAAFSHINLIPFRDFLMGHGGARKEFLLNVLMTVPFGVFLPLIYGKSFSRTVGWALVFSLAIEILQLFSGNYRIADVTDVISNTVGGAAGFTLFLPFRRAALSGTAARAGSTGPRGASKREKAVWAAFLLQILVKSFLAAYF